MAVSGCRIMTTFVCMSCCLVPRERPLLLVPIKPMCPNRRRNRESPCVDHLRDPASPWGDMFLDVAAGILFCWAVSVGRKRSFPVSGKCCKQLAHSHFVVDKLAVDAAVAIDPGADGNSDQRGHVVIRILSVESPEAIRRNNREARRIQLTVTSWPTRKKII